MKKPIVSNIPENTYCVVRFSEPNLYGFPRGNPLGLQSGDYICVKNGDTMIYNIFEVNTISSVGFVGDYDTDFITLKDTNQVANLLNQDTRENLPNIEYSSDPDCPVTNGEKDASLYKKYGIFKYDATLKKLEHPRIPSVINTTDNSVFVNSQLNSDEDPVANPLVYALNYKTNERFTDEIFRVVTMIPTNVVPQTAVDLLHSAFQGELLVDRGHLNSSIHTEDYPIKVNSSAEKYDLQLAFYTDYKFQLQRASGDDVDVNLVTSDDIQNWNAGTSVQVYNRSKSTFAKVPVKAFGGGSTRILQNCAIGSQVKLFAKLDPDAVFSTSITGYVISVTNQ